MTVMKPASGNKEKVARSEGALEKPLKDLF